jgi:hypothetical protein
MTSRAIDRHSCIVTRQAKAQKAPFPGPFE